MLAKHACPWRHQVYSHVKSIVTVKFTKEICVAEGGRWYSSTCRRIWLLTAGLPDPGAAVSVTASVSAAAS